MVFAFLVACEKDIGRTWRQLADSGTIYCAAGSLVGSGPIAGRYIGGQSFCIGNFDPVFIFCLGPISKDNSNTIFCATSR